MAENERRQARIWPFSRVLSLHQNQKHQLCGRPVAAERTPLREESRDLDDYINYDDPKIRAWTEWVDNIITATRQRGTPPSECLLNDWTKINAWTIMRIESLPHYVHAQGDAAWWHETMDGDDDDEPEEGPLSNGDQGSIILTPELFSWLEKSFIEQE